MPIMNSNSSRSDDDNEDEPIPAKKIRPDDGNSCDATTEEKNVDLENEELTNDETNNEAEDQEASLLNDNGQGCDDDADDLFQFPPDTDDITEMLDGITYSSSGFPTIMERYFTPYYKLDVQCPKDDICIFMHSNRICMLALARSHAVFQTTDNERQITAVNFKVSHKLDRAQNKVFGKSKHGAQPLQTNSNICIITCSDGKTYTIKCCMIGKLVEVNEALVQDPKLLLAPPHRGGYLAIILPNIKLLEKVKKSLLTQEQYESMMLERETALCENLSETSSNVQNTCSSGE